MLGVSRASAGEMLKRLEAEGLVERGEHKEAILTATGRERAEQVVRKHRIDRAAPDRLHGLHGAEAHVHADELGETFSDDMVERIERAARPSRPLPPRLAGRHRRRAGREPRARAARPSSSRARAPTIVRLAEHDGELLHWFYDQGLVPGTEVEVREAQPAAEQLTVRLDGGERTIAEKAAAGLFVRPGLGRGRGGGRRARPPRGALRLVRPLPREVVVVAAEVAVRRGLRVDRPPQVEVAQDRRRAEVEVLVDRAPRSAPTGIALGAEGRTAIETGCATPIA